jgi:DNA topoisomerase-1
MTKLLIVESPGKVDKLTAILGPGWRVAASKGHIRDLPEDEIGVEAPEFRPKYVFIPGAPIPGQKGKHYPSSKDRVDRLIAMAQDAEAVYLATDPDREGESISWHLQQAMKLKNPHRVTFNEVTAAAVKAAVATPRVIDVKLVAAQEARRVIDRLVGYLVSPVATDLASQKLSAGRVQTPAVWLAVTREREIAAFKPTNHYGAMLNFAGAKLDWKAEWETKPDFTSDDEPYFMDQGFAERVAATRSVTVAAFNAGENKRAPPAPFTTSTLQQAASVKLGMSPAQTMEAAQRLFDQGHITYHRTDNPNVSDESLPDIFAVATKLGLDMADEPRKFKANEAAQAGHPACTPTHWEVEEAGESDQDASLYKLIRLRAIACQLADARYAVHTATLAAPGLDGSPELKFSCSGRTLVYSGWMKLLAKDDTDEDAEPEALNPVPSLKVGEHLDVKAGEVLSKRTKAPKRYTEASLVRKLEAEGVGRPSTYASIMETIVAKRQYLEVVTKFLRPTPKGIALIDALQDKFQFVLPSFTRGMEQQLDAIAQGREGYKPVVERMYGALHTELTRVQDAMPKFACASCGKSLRRIVMPGKTFWGCTGHPTCTVTLPDEDGKPGVKKGSTVTEFACGKCGKPLIHRQKKGSGGYDFFSCSGFSEGCKQAYENKDGTPNFAPK